METPVIDVTGMPKVDDSAPAAVVFDPAVVTDVLIHVYRPQDSPKTPVAIGITPGDASYSFVYRATARLAKGNQPWSTNAHGTLLQATTPLLERVARYGIVKAEALPPQLGGSGSF